MLFEAPQKNQQVWFLQKIGPSVNLGNIAPDEVIPLETLRLGLARRHAVGFADAGMRRRSPGGFPSDNDANRGGAV